MINPYGENVTKNFIVSGVKEIGDYIYVLLIDLAGQTLIKRIKTDNSEIKFVKKESETIADFWIDPTIHNYKYVHEV